MSTLTHLPDGVYVGFNVPGINDKSVPHPYIEVVLHAKPIIYEYGPSASLCSTFDNEQHTYQDSDRNAGALYRLFPPKGSSQDAYINRAIELGEKLNDNLEQHHIKYCIVNGVTCDTATLAMLENLGVRGEQFFAMTNGASNDPLVRAYLDGGALTPYGRDHESFSATHMENIRGREVLIRDEVYHDRLKELSSYLFTQVGAAPGMEYPGTGKASYHQMEFVHDRWQETPELHPNPHPGMDPNRAPHTHAMNSRNSEQLVAYENTNGRYQAYSIEPSVNTNENRNNNGLSDDLAERIQAAEYIRRMMRDSKSGFSAMSIMKAGITNEVTDFRSQQGRIITMSDGNVVHQSVTGQTVGFDIQDFLERSHDPSYSAQMLQHSYQNGKDIHLDIQANQAHILTPQDVALERQQLAIEQSRQIER